MVHSPCSGALTMTTRVTSPFGLGMAHGQGTPSATIIACWTISKCECEMVCVSAHRGRSSEVQISPCPKWGDPHGGLAAPRFTHLRFRLFEHD